MKQKFIILCHLLDGGEYLYKSSFDTIDRVLDAIRLVNDLSSYDDVVSYEIIDVCHFDRNIRLRRDSFVTNEK